MKYDKNTFYCFSPPVMIATFIIEIALAVYTILRYKCSAVTRLVVVLLVSLAIFQLAEFMVCQGYGNSLLWSRVGFVAITILPPVSLHLLHVISKAKRRWIPWPGYIAGAAFITFFSLWPGAITGNQCMGNYVIFQLAQHAGGLYGAYYYSLLGAALLLGWYYLRQKHTKKVHKAIAGLMFSYAIFLIPTTIAVLANPQTLSAIPSIMCGFAVLLAVVLALLVLPWSAQRRR